jgi:CRP-like cAMP-binding protein
VIASRFPIEWAFYVNALTFLISAGCTALAYIPPLDMAGQTNVVTVMRNLRLGLNYLFGTSILRSLLLGCVPAFLGYGLFNSVLLPFALRALRATEFQYGLMEAFQSAGFIVTALLMVGLADRLREGQWIALSYLGVATTFLLCALASSVPLAIAINIALGLLNAPNYVGRSLLIQRNTTREVRGRVNSAFLVARNIMYLLGMAGGGLADVLDVRWLLIASSLLAVVTGVLMLVLPGVGQPAGRPQALRLLQMAPAAPGLGRGRAAMPADLDLLAIRLPALAGLSAKDRKNLASRARVHELPAGTTILCHGERSDAAYFILDGCAVVGHTKDGRYRMLGALHAGDFFGEIAALIGVPRTADVVAEQPTIVLQVPAATLRHIASAPYFNRLFLSTLTERMVRLNMIDLPRFAGLDQQSLHELRTTDLQSAA